MCGRWAVRWDNAARVVHDGEWIEAEVEVEVEVEE